MIGGKESIMKHARDPLYGRQLPRRGDFLCGLAPFRGPLSLRYVPEVGLQDGIRDMAIGAGMPQVKDYSQ